MRVLFLTDSLSDLDGVGRYAVRLIAAMEELRPDLEVEILLARKHRPTSSAVPAHWNVRVALPPDYFFHMQRGRFWANALPAIARTWSAARGADLVHAIKDYPHNWIASSAARAAQKPLIATAHGTYSVQPLLSARHARRARSMYARVARLISVSRFTQSRLHELLSEEELPRARSLVIANAVRADHYEAARAIGPREWHRYAYTLSIGELKERKGHHLALEAFTRVARRHVGLQHVIVGKLSGDAYEERLRAIVRDAGLGSRVHFLGNVSEDEKVDLLQRSLAFVHTPVTSSDGGFEGFGIVYLEAGAAGVPALGTLGCGAEDALVDGESGFLVEPRVDAVEAALERLVSDPDLRVRMGAAGRARARASSWRENARAVLALYDAVLAEARTQSSA